MASNIGCFIAGCNNSVIGQCSGYKCNCGRFYCHTHSIARFCKECGDKAVREQTFQDHLATAKGIKEPGIFARRKTIEAHRKHMADVEKTKPGFRKFYEWYKKAEEEAERERKRQLNREVTAAFFRGVGTGLGNAVNEAGKAIATPPPAILQGTPRDVERAAIQSLEKTIANKK